MDSTAGKDSSVLGGWNDMAESIQTVVSGGWNNKVPGIYASISGGCKNIASGKYASVSGWDNIKAEGDTSIVLVRMNNNVAGIYTHI